MTDEEEDEPPFPMEPGIVLICGKCTGPRKNDTYGALCEDCYNEVSNAKLTKAKIARDSIE